MKNKSFFVRMLPMSRERDVRKMAHIKRSKGGDFNQLGFSNVKKPVKRCAAALLLLSCVPAAGFADSWLGRGMTVATSPFFGLRSAYNASDVVINLPTINEDLRLLQQRQATENRLKAEHRANFPRRPMLEISGGLEGQGVLSRGYDRRTSHDVDLTRASLHLFAQISPWIQGLMTLEYDNSPATVSGSTSTRVANSNLFLKRGFFTVGNLNKSPLYASVGQMYVPFGRYATNLISSPMTLSIGRTRQRAVLVGFYNQGIYASAYGFNGDTFVSSNNLVDTWGANLGYQNSLNGCDIDFGVGFISNVAESEGMQATGGEGFAGFGALGSTSEQITRRVPAVNLHAEFQRGAWGATAEYITAMRFNATDLSFNGKGAKPSALHVEGNYQTKVMALPVLLGVGYGQSRQALALNLPRQAYYAVVNTSPWKNTIVALEYKHANNYADTDTAGGNGADDMASAGSHSNALTLQMGVYF